MNSSGRTTSRPKERGSRLMIGSKQSPADGFMIVNLFEETATCEMHSYSTTHEFLCKAGIPAVPKGSKTGLLL